MAEGFWAAGAAEQLHGQREDWAGSCDISASQVLRLVDAVAEAADEDMVSASAWVGPGATGLQWAPSDKGGRSSDSPSQDQLHGSPVTPRSNDETSPASTCPVAATPGRAACSPGPKQRGRGRPLSNWQIRRRLSKKQEPPTCYTLLGPGQGKWNGALRDVYSQVREEFVKTWLREQPAEYTRCTPYTQRRKAARQAWASLRAAEKRRMCKEALALQVA